MANFAPVVPISMARLLKNWDELGTYHLLLAHDVLADPEGYKEVYGDIDRNDSMIILDNSLVELGRPMTIDEMANAIQVVNPHYVVLPDILLDFKETIRLGREALSQWQSLPTEVKGEVRLMPVIQGKTINEIFQCVQWAAYTAQAAAVAVPRVLTEQLGSRMWAVNMIARVSPFMAIHLLGFSDNLLDDVACARHPSVIGIDSAVPVRAALKGYSLWLAQHYDCGKRGNYWDEVYTQNGLRHNAQQDITMNLQKIRKWIHLEMPEI